MIAAFAQPSSLMQGCDVLTVTATGLRARLVGDRVWWRAGRAVRRPEDRPRWRAGCRRCSSGTSPTISPAARACARHPVIRRRHPSMVLAWTAAIRVSCRARSQKATAPRASSSSVSSSGMISWHSRRSATRLVASPTACRARASVHSTAYWKAACRISSLLRRYGARAPLAYPASAARSRVVTASSPLRAMSDEAAATISRRCASWSTIFGMSGGISLPRRERFPDAGSPCHGRHRRDHDEGADVLRPAHVAGTSPQLGEHYSPCPRDRPATGHQQRESACPGTSTGTVVLHDPSHGCRGRPSAEPSRHAARRGQARESAARG